MTNTITLVVVAVLVALAIVGAAWYLGRQMREDTPDATEHVTDDGGGDGHARPAKGSTKVPLRDRAKGVSSTAKLFFASLGFLFIIIGVFAFQTFRTGSPAEVMYADQLVTALKVLIGVVAGIVMKALAQRNEGTLINVYEGDDGNTREETLTIDLRDVDHDNEGHHVVKEYSNTRVFGLFRRYKYVAEDPTLEGTHRAPGKVIEHQIPDHAIDVDQKTWINLTTARNDTNDPDVRADYVYSSPVELSYEKYLDLQHKVRRKDIQLKGTEALLATVQREFNKLERKLKSGEYKAEDTLLAKVDDIADILTKSNNGAGGEDHRPPRSTYVTPPAQQGVQQPQTGQKQAETDGGTR